MALLVFSSIALQEHLKLVEYVSKNHKRTGFTWFPSNDTVTLESSTVQSSGSSSSSSSSDNDSSGGFQVSDHRHHHYRYHHHYHSVSVYSSWKLPTDIRIVSLHNGGEALQFVGKAGKGVRSVQAPQALPKPRQYTLLMQKTPSPKNSETKTTLKSWRRQRRSKQPLLLHTSPAKVTWYPFSDPFILPNGNMCEKDRLISYFEVNILEDPQNLSEIYSLSELYIFEDLSCDPTNSFGSHKSICHPECVAVGIATADFERAKSLPGCRLMSFGYHGDDGSLFAETKRTTGIASPFGSGDVIGCGVDYIKQQVFFTKNGEFVAYVENTMDTAQFAKSKWIPTVGVDAPEVRFTVNTTGPFIYDFLTLDTESDGTREV
jgi:hypothetical protein